MQDTTLSPKVAAAYAAALAYVRAQNPFHLSSLAECSTPDTKTSAGALMLESVRDGVAELMEYDPEAFAEAADCHSIGDLDDRGAVADIADAAPDVYTHTKWAEFVDLGAYNEDPTELGEDGSDMDRAASICLYMIADRLARVLLEEAGEAFRDYLAEHEENEDEDEDDA